MKYCGFFLCLLSVGAALPFAALVRMYGSVNIVTATVVFSLIIRCVLEMLMRSPYGLEIQENDEDSNTPNL